MIEEASEVHKELTFDGVIAVAQDNLILEKIFIVVNFVFDVLKLRVELIFLGTRRRVQI